MKEPKTTHVLIRLTITDRDILRANAAGAGLSMSDFIRSKCINAFPVLTTQSPQESTATTPVAPTPTSSGICPRCARMGRTVPSCPKCAQSTQLLMEYG